MIFLTLHKILVLLETLKILLSKLILMILLYLKEYMQHSLSSAATWLTNNRLVVNPNKSNFIVIGHPSKTYQLDFDLYLNNVKLPSCKSTKLLGIVIDDHLSWDDHVHYLLKKMSPKLGLLRRLSFSFLLMFYLHYICQLYSHI